LAFIIKIYHDAGPLNVKLLLVLLFDYIISVVDE